ncbi:MAG: S1C family serine protease [Acidobacteriia bacterium]|nr:S1C family serine protease [Terriglobia bacterium]
MLVLLFALVSVCLAESPGELAKRGFKSVVLLAMNDSNGQPLCIGSGFFVSENVVATNAHVIEDAGSGSAKLVGQAHTYQILGTLAIDRHADLALLKVSGKAPSLRLSPGPGPSIGDSVYVIGNPLGLEGTFSAGIISGIRHTGSDSIVQMTAPISPGSSGGPVMDVAGEVIGVAVATFKEGQNLNLAVPVSYLAKMLETHPAVVAPLRPTLKSSNASTSIIDGLGTRTEEGVLATDFRSSYPRSYQIRLTNKLPVAVSQIDVVVVFYDHSGKMLDFDRFRYAYTIPAGLTKDVEQTYVLDSIEAGNWQHGHYTFKVEMRVIGFNTGESQY